MIAMARKSSHFLSTRLNEDNLGPKSTMSTMQQTVTREKSARQTRFSEKQNWTKVFNHNTTQVLSPMIYVTSIVPATGFNTTVVPTKVMYERRQTISLLITGIFLSILAAGWIITRIKPIIERARTDKKANRRRLDPEGKEGKSLSNGDIRPSGKRYVSTKVPCKSGVRSSYRQRGISEPRSKHAADSVRFAAENTSFNCTDELGLTENEVPCSLDIESRHSCVGRSSSETSQRSLDLEESEKLPYLNDKRILNDVIFSGPVITV